jgi:hypothetical protein
MHGARRFAGPASFEGARRQQWRWCGIPTTAGCAHHILKTPREVDRCVEYLRTNAAKHYRIALARDAFTSYAPFMRPRPWLLKRLE